MDRDFKFTGIIKQRSLQLSCKLKVCIFSNRFYEPLNDQNQKCILCWFSLRGSHNNVYTYVQVAFNLEGIFICDLGLAKLRDAAQGTMTTVTQHLIGTYPYMAPVMLTICHRSAAVDIHSLGCLYIELFGKKRIWPTGMSSAQIMQKVCGS